MIPPYIGAIVHYYPIGDDAAANFTRDEGAKAAMIVAIHDDSAVDLIVFISALIPSAGVLPRTHVPHGTLIASQVNGSPHWEWIHTAALANVKTE